jgi:hypothetical protein
VGNREENVGTRAHGDTNTLDKNSPCPLQSDFEPEASLPLKNRKTAAFVLRSTGEFHDELYSPPVNLPKPIEKVVAAAEHC